MIEFKNPQKIILPLVISLATSIITIIIIMVFFFLVLLSSDSNALMPGILGGMSVLPIFGLSFAFYLLRSPVSIVVTDSGLTVEWLIRQKTFSWNMISRLELKGPGIFHNWASSMKNKSEPASETLVIFGRNSKKLVEIGDNIENFSVLMEQIRQRGGLIHKPVTLPLGIPMNIVCVHPSSPRLRFKASRNYTLNLKRMTSPSLTS